MKINSLIKFCCFVNSWVLILAFKYNKRRFFKSYFWSIYRQLNFGVFSVFSFEKALGKSILLYYTIQILFVSVTAKIMFDTPFLLLPMYKKCTQKKFDLPCSEKILIRIYWKNGYMQNFFFCAQLLILLLHIHTLLPNVHMYMHKYI